MTRRSHNATRPAIKSHLMDLFEPASVASTLPSISSSFCETAAGRRFHLGLHGDLKREMQRFVRRIFRQSRIDLARFSPLNSSSIRPIIPFAFNCVKRRPSWRLSPTDRFATFVKQSALLPFPSPLPPRSRRTLSGRARRESYRLINDRRIRGSIRI